MGTKQIPTWDAGVVDRLKVRVYPDRLFLGRAAAQDVAEKLRAHLARQGHARVVFGSAPSQDDFIAHLRAARGVAWERVTVFQMDEYIGLPPESPQRFSTYLQERLFEAVRPHIVHTLDPGNDPDRECERYAELLAAKPLDVVCLGIGENGHLAFNDPPVADFRDTRLLKVVELDHQCRRQQVRDGSFPQLDLVPRYAVTLTIPALLSGLHLSCVVPGAVKATAVRDALTGPVEETCPASVLRRHQDCVLYLDADSASAVDSSALRRPQTRI